MTLQPPYLDAADFAIAADIAITEDAAVLWGRWRLIPDIFEGRR